MLHLFVSLIVVVKLLLLLLYVKIKAQVAAQLSHTKWPLS